jgi:hypothetical protein
VLSLVGAESSGTLADDHEPSLEVAEEQRRLDQLRRLVDVTCALLRQSRVSRREAEGLVAHARSEALRLFPGKSGVFDLVLAPRFRRILDERWPADRGRLLPFRRGG